MLKPVFRHVFGVQTFNDEYLNAESRKVESFYAESLNVETFNAENQKT
jgi:hypothetical protein